MKKQKLNYRFHNPNTAEVTADYILKVFIEVNAKKVERVMQEVAEECRRGQAGSKIKFSILNDEKCRKRNYKAIYERKSQI